MYYLISGSDILSSELQGIFQSQSQICNFGQFIHTNLDIMKDGFKEMLCKIYFLSGTESNRKDRSLDRKRKDQERKKGGDIHKGVIQ